MTESGVDPAAEPDDAKDAELKPTTKRATITKDSLTIVDGGGNAGDVAGG